MMASEITQLLPDIVSYFELGLFVGNPQVLEGGKSNKNILLRLADGSKVVVKFLVNQTGTSIANEVAIQQQLAERSLLQTTVFKRSEKGQGSVLFQKDCLQAVVSDFLPGTRANSVDIALSRGIGVALAQIHLAVTTLPHTHHGWLNLETVRKSCAVLNSENELVHQALQLIEQGREALSEDLPRGIIHGDLDTSNLFADATTGVVTTVFDFEEAEENFLLMDLVKSINANCHTEPEKPEKPEKIDLRLADAMIAGYESVRSLNANEKANLVTLMNYVSGASALWFIKNDYPVDAKNQILRANSFRRS